MSRQSNLYARIYQIVRQIPPGSVTSYGNIAGIVQCNARQVGYAMAATPEGSGIPWHRVVNAQGEISARTQGDGDREQRQLLISEGIVFDTRQRIDLDRYGWIEADMPFLFHFDENDPQDEMEID